MPLHAIARLALGIASVLGAGGGVVVVAALVAGAHSLRGQPGAPHDFTVAGQQMTYPSVNVAALVTVALAGAAAIAVLRGGRAVTSQVLAARRVRRLGRQGETTPAGYVRFTDERPMAFCAGLLHPRVFVSDGALRALAADELRAVLAHEHHHCRRRDPLRVAVVGGMAEALFFLPAVAHVRDRYVALADLRADDAAVAACGGDRAPLANAMMIFDEAAGPAGAIGIAPERVDRLLGVPPALALGRSRVVAAVLTIAAACGLAWRAGHAASLQATLAPPLLSHRPCVVVFVCTQACLSALALMVCARLAPGRRRAVARRPR